MKSLTQYSEQQGKKPTGQFAATRFILDNPEARAIFLKVAKEAEQEYLSDTIAAQYLVDNYKQFLYLRFYLDLLDVLVKIDHLGKILQFWL